MVAEEGIFKMILRGKVDLQTAPWPSISAPAKHLVMALLNRDPMARYTAQQVPVAVATLRASHRRSPLAVRIFSMQGLFTREGAVLGLSCPCLSLETACNAAAIQLQGR